MILTGEIQQFEEIPPKKEGDTPLYRLVIADKSLPSAARCSTPLEFFLGDKGREKLPKGDLTDLRVNVLIREMKQGRTGIQCRGEVVQAAPVGNSDGKAASKVEPLKA